MLKKITAIALCAVSLSAAADIFNQKPAFGSGAPSQASNSQTQVNTGQNNCATLANERRAIEHIDQKQIWVPIEQQNANYHRMRYLKLEMAARGCQY